MKPSLSVEIVIAHVYKVNFYKSEGLKGSLFKLYHKQLTVCCPEVYMNTEYIFQFCWQIVQVGVRFSTALSISLRVLFPV